jgi:site-specific DNA recombinase
VKPAAIYARVSSDKQKEEHTIASQTAALRGFARQQGFTVPDEWVIEDEGYSGATLVRPGLERLRDLAAEGQIDAVLVYSPDRLSRKYAYQVLLIEELARHNVQTVFIKAPQTATPEDQLLLQFQGMIAEYERAQILERSRRGKRIVPCRELSMSFAALRMAIDISARLSTRPHLTPSSTVRRLWCARSMNTTPSRV